MPWQPDEVCAMRTFVLRSEIASGRESDRTVHRVDVAASTARRRRVVAVDQAAAREIASTATRAMPTIKAIPHVDVLDVARWEADGAAPGGYGEWGSRGAVRVAALQWVGEAGGLCVWRGVVVVRRGVHDSLGGPPSDSRRWLGLLQRDQVWRHVDGTSDGSRCPAAHQATRGGMAGCGGAGVDAGPVVRQTR